MSESGYTSSTKGDSEFTSCGEHSLGLPRRLKDMNLYMNGRSKSVIF